MPGSARPLQCATGRWPGSKGLRFPRALRARESVPQATDLDPKGTYPLDLVPIPWTESLSSGPRCFFLRAARADSHMLRIG